MGLHSTVTHDPAVGQPDPHRPYPPVPPLEVQRVCGDDSSHDAADRRSLGAVGPSLTTTGTAEPIPAAPAGPFVDARDSNASTHDTVDATMRNEITRVGIPVPPIPAARPTPPRNENATVVCLNPLMRPPVDETTEGGTVVMLLPQLLAPAYDEGETTESGTVIALNPLLLVRPPETPRAHVEPSPASSPEPGTPMPIADGKPEPTPVPTAMSGATAVFLGRLGSDEADDRDPIFVPEGESLEVGAKRGNPFARDPFVARYHAALIPGRDGILVEDFGTANGVYVRVDGRMALRDDDRLRIGQQLLRFHRMTTLTEDSGSVRRIGSPDPGVWGRVAIMLDPYREAAAYPLRARSIELGQQTGDIQFPCDATVAEPHCRLELDADDHAFIATEPSAASYVRLERGDVVAYGSELLIGETRLRLERAG